MKLTQDIVLYADMINAMALGADILYEDEDALLIQDQHSEIYYCAAIHLSAARRMAEQLPQSFSILVSHDTFSNEAIYEKSGIHYENRCYHCAYLLQQPLFYQLPEEYELRMLTRLELDAAIQLYQKEMPELANCDYMGACMEYGMPAIFHHNNLCGFVGVHEGGYGSIGMLEVAPAYQRNGLASILEKAMINHQLSNQRLPYGEIFEDNLASLKLQKKLGLSISNQLTYWFYQ